MGWPSGDLAVLGAFAAALVVTLLITPAARRLAVATGFYDLPVGYKQHDHATPYLGGSAVVGGILVGTLITGAELGDLLPLLLAAVALLALGTADDRSGLPVSIRLAGETAVAVFLWATGWGWPIFENEALNMILTVVWVVGLVNAFNLMDNMDGAAAAVAAASAAGAGALALASDQSAAAVVAFAVAGACLGFLPYNLARPSRIFLGDGGSMPIGLLIAASIMVIPSGDTGMRSLVELTPVVGLVILDTALVVVSRVRRGAKVYWGARDHLTHRLLPVLGSARRVALFLGATQAGLCALVIALDQLDLARPLWGAAFFVATGVIVIAVLERLLLPSFRSERSA